MTSRPLAISVVALLLGVLAPSSAAAAEECKAVPRTACFGLSSAGAQLSTFQAGAHPEVRLDFEVKQDPTTEENSAGFKAPYALTRDVRFELPPGLIGDPNAMGSQQQCTVQELVSELHCPNGSQVGLTTVSVYGFGTFTESVYMMKPPGGDVAAQVGFVAAIYPTLIDNKVRSESDYGLDAEVLDAVPTAGLLAAHTTIWGVPASPVHDRERCTPEEVFSESCTESPPRPPGSRQLPFWTNPTTCGVPLQIRVAASSWSEPDRFDTAQSTIGQIADCNRLPFGPSMTLEPTSHHTDSPTGADITLRLPASEGVEVLEPSQMRDLKIKFPPGLVFNPGAAQGAETCSPAQVGFGTREPSHCPQAAKLANTEFDIPVLERNLRGAVSLREPEPGHPFRVWITADDLGLHVKLSGELEVDKQTGQVTSITTDIPQAPVREAKIDLKSGFRAPLITPQHCGTFQTEYEFTPWSGGQPKIGETSMEITEGCDTGGFNPKLQAGSTDAQGGAFSPFTFTLTREDGEENISGLNITLPKGIAASFAGVARCEGVDAETGHCPAASRIGKTVAAVGAGPAPLWVPQEGKRPTAVYLSGPYKGAPLSIVAVVPKQAGPFDFGDEVVRSAVYVDPVTAQATAKADPLPQLVEGIPITYRTINVQLDRQGFSLNPTSCAAKETKADLTSTGGKSASPTSAYAASDCAKLPFEPSLTVRLKGGTHRGSHPKLSATLRMPEGGANIAGTQVTLPLSEYVENAHFKTICTRVQFAAKECPAESVYGTAVAHSPLFDFPLEGPVYLRSSKNPLPDLVMALHGPASMPIEVDVAGEVDSVNGQLRSTFNEIPDAPVSEFTLQMQGGDKSLIVNSANLCTNTYRAKAYFSGQNGKTKLLHPALKTSCKKKAKHKRHAKHKRQR